MTTSCVLRGYSPEKAQVCNTICDELANTRIRQRFPGDDHGVLTHRARPAHLFSTFIHICLITASNITQKIAEQNGTEQKQNRNIKTGILYLEYQANTGKLVISFYCIVSPSSKVGLEGFFGTG